MPQSWWRGAKGIQGPYARRLLGAWPARLDATLGHEPEALPTLRIDHADQLQGFRPRKSGRLYRQLGRSDSGRCRFPDAVSANQGLAGFEGPRTTRLRPGVCGAHACRRGQEMIGRAALLVVTL